MSFLQELRQILEKEDLLGRGPDFEERYGAAFRNKSVRRLLEIKTPKITDLTDILEIGHGGRLYAVRMDLNKGVDNHKKPVVAGLILRGVLEGSIPREGIDTLIDGGNFNSAKALKYYSRLLGMRGMYIMSRLFPQEIIDMLIDDKFEVIRAPEKYAHAREREFYEYLVGLMRHNEFRRNKFCLLHARYGGRSMHPIGVEVAESLDRVPDYVVSCLGAGSTLEGLQIPVKDYFSGEPSIVIAEHELSPLFDRFIRTRASLGSIPSVDREVKIVDPGFYAKHAELPHIVIGPHFDEINPLLSKGAILRVDEVVQYSEHDWMAIQKYLSRYGISVGNSSAANLSVAAGLANQGNNVLTMVFEPFREFYRGHDTYEPQVIPWLLRLKTPAQKAALTAAAGFLMGVGVHYFLNPPPDDAPSWDGMSIGKTSILRGN